MQEDERLLPSPESSDDREEEDLNENDEDGAELANDQEEGGELIDVGGEEDSAEDFDTVTFTTLHVRSSFSCCLPCHRGVLCLAFISLTDSIKERRS